MGASSQYYHFCQPLLSRSSQEFLVCLRALPPSAAKPANTPENAAVASSVLILCSPVAVTFSSVVSPAGVVTPSSFVGSSAGGVITSCCLSATSRGSFCLCSPSLPPC